MRIFFKSDAFYVCVSRAERTPLVRINIATLASSSFQQRQKWLFQMFYLLFAIQSRVPLNLYKYIVYPTANISHSHSKGLVSRGAMCRIYKCCNLHIKAHVCANKSIDKRNYIYISFNVTVSKSLRPLHCGPIM